MTKTLNMTKILGMSALLTGFAIAPALAQDNAILDWDADNNSSVTSEEFVEGFGNIGAYNAWDSDRNGNLTEDEFNTGIYSRYDADGNGVIEEPEFGDLNDDMGDGGFWDV